MTHTPTPYCNDGPQVFEHDDGTQVIEFGVVSDETGEVVTLVHTLRGEEQANTDVDFICRACNAHDDLLAACKVALERIESDIEYPGGTCLEGDSLRAAITKATSTADSS